MMDVIVVGAGPSGSTLADKLSSQGLKVMMIESQAWPRFKPCGGGITKRCYDNLDVNISDIIEDITYNLMLTVNHRIGVELISHTPLIYQVDRMKFDALLAENAIKHGAEFHTKEKFLDFHSNEDYISVETEKGTYECRVLAGADGVNSMVRKRMGFKRLHMGTAVETEAKPLKGRLEGLKGKAHVDFGVIKGGYGWNFPKADSASIGVGTLRQKAADLRNDLYNMLDGEGLSDSGDVRIYGHPLVFNNGRRDRYNRDNVILVGDAAGLADPFTGEGIYHSVISARIASEVIKDWFEGNADIKSYTDRINSEVRPEIRSSYELAMFCYHFLPPVMLTLKNFPVIFRYFVDVITGIDDFRCWQTKVPACMVGVKKPVSKIDLKYIR